VSLNLLNLLNSVAPVVVGISAVLIFYTALLHLSRKSITGSYKFRILRDVLLGIQILQLYFLSKNLQLDYPILFFPFITLLFVTGPLSYMRYHMFFYPGGKIPDKVKLQLIPAAIVLIGEIWFYFFNMGSSREILRNVFSNPPQYFITYVILIGVLVTLVQNGVLLKFELSFVDKKETREPVMISSAILILYMLDMLLIAGGFFFSHRVILLTGILLIGVTGITYLLFENRFPDFYQLVAREERQKKYKKSLLEGVSKEKIMERLRELMDLEQIYSQLDLKLDDVAAMLLITPHQLSEFMNDVIGINFASYINKYRVRAAKNLLIEHPEKSTLEIAFEVGFGSKASFNTIFKQQTGMTPSEFRKKGTVL
jgi:AraC-like DNA-binding protein